MSEWTSLPIRECLVSHFAGEWGEDPNPANVQVLRATNVSDEMTVDVEGGAHRKITAKKLDEKQLLSGDIILEASGGSNDKPVGRVAFFESELTQKFVVSNFFRTLRPNRSVVDPKFFCLLLHWLYAQPPIKAMQQQTTGIINLKLEQYLGYQVDVPVDVAEQKAIAKILDTLDTQIRQTEAIIAKLQQVKQGLLHDLLTRGIDANGQLRPPPDHAPELYKDSPLGWIPREWEAVTLGKMLNRIEGGWSPNCPESRPSVGEWGVLKVSAVTSGAYKDHEAKVLPVELKPRPSLEVKEGDVILTRANGNPDLVAKTVMVGSTQGKLMLSDKLLRLVPESSLLPFLLYFLMDFYKTRHQVAALISGSSGQKNVSQKQIRGLIVPQLTLGEQERAVEKVQSINSRIAREQLELSKLRLKKSGLMDDLLTGRVRVTSLLDTAKAS